MDLPERQVAAVIPAAGIGSRMQSSLPKQYLTIQGKTVLEHSILAMLRDPRVGCVVVVLAADDPYFNELKMTIDVPLYTVTGGATRAESVAAGVAAAQQHGYRYVAVHDAARPCLARSELAAVIEQGLSHPAGAILALPVADTIKRAHADQTIDTTIPRHGLWQALTPQVFRVSVLLDAWRIVGVSDPQLTDEASAIEALGLAPRLVLGRRTNLKITQPGDETMAAAFLPELAKE